MTDSEKLDLILSKIDSMNSRLGNLENKVDNLENRFDNLENKVDDLEQKQLQTRVTLENTIDKAIQALGEGYQLNAERFDKLDIEAVRNKADIAIALSRLTSEKVDRLIEKLNQSA